MKRTVYQFQRPKGIYRITAEQITIAISSLIVTILVGLICFIWLTQNDEPPVITVTQTAPAFTTGGQYYIPYTVSNKGGDTADSVQILAELKVGGEAIETAEQQVDFLSSREQADGMFIFENDPAQGEFTIKSTGYRLP